jgi:hypothetical protein
MGLLDVGIERPGRKGRRKTVADAPQARWSAGRRAWYSVKVRIPAETAQFLLEHGGLMATRDAANRPTAVEAVLLELDAETGIGGIAAFARFARNTAANLRDNGRFALMISRPWNDHRSVQLKGRCVEVREPVVDPERIGPRTELFAAVLESFGLPQQVADDFRRMRFDSYYLVRVEIEEVFDQTPGAGAGRRILPAGPSSAP